MKRLTAMLLCALTLLACAACGGKEEAVPEIAPQVSRMRSICELAVMECYYHNVAKYMEEDAAGIWLWKKDKHFWIEYSGVVELGVDASLVSMELQGDTVTITLPEALVLSCTVDSSSLTEDSFIVDKSSAKITAGDETAAFAQAQARMEEHAAGDRVLLASARERAQALLEAYVRNIGAAVGREYAVRWELLEGETPPPAEAEAPEGA